MNDKQYKIVAIQIDSNRYFIVSHNSKGFDYTNQIIDANLLFSEFAKYSKCGFIAMEDIMLIKNLHDKVIDYNELYELFESIIITNRLLYGESVEYDKKFILV